MPTKSKARKTGRPTEIDCGALLDAAEELFSEKGFAATTTREVVKRARCNIALISYHFGSKDGLYQALLVRHFDEIRKQYSSIDFSDALLAKAWPELRDPAQRLFCASVHELVKRMASNTRMQKILCREMMNGGTKLAAALSKSESGSFNLLRSRLESLQSLGKLRKDVDLRYAILNILGPVVYSFIAGPVLKQVYGFGSLDERYFRDLCLYQTRIFFEGWAS